MGKSWSEILQEKTWYPFGSAALNALITVYNLGAICIFLGGTTGSIGDDHWIALTEASLRVTKELHLYLDEVIPVLRDLRNEKFVGFLRVPGWNQGEGVFLGNPKDSVWEDWGTLGNPLPLGGPPPP